MPSSNTQRSWLEETRQLDLSNPRLRIFAQKLTQSRQTVHARATAIHDHVRRLRFVPATRPSRASASQILSRGQGSAYAKAVLFIALCRAAGIPSRLAVARVREPHTGDQSLHVLAEVETGGGWIRTDGFIVDPVLFAAAKQALRAEGADSGWGIVADARGEWDGRSTCLQQFHPADAVETLGPFADVDEFVARRAPKRIDWLHAACGWMAARIAAWRIERMRARARHAARVSMA